MRRQIIAAKQSCFGQNTSGSYRPITMYMLAIIHVQVEQTPIDDIIILLAV